MNNIDILNKISNNEISIKKAYKMLYKEKKPRRAHFVKLRIRIPDEKWVSRLINFLFLLPIPVFIIKFFLRKSERYVSNEIQIPIKDLIDVIGVKGAFVDVVSKDNEKVIIKTL